MTGDNDENFKDTDEDNDEDLNYKNYEDGNEDGPRFWREYNKHASLEARLVLKLCRVTMSQVRLGLQT